MNKAAGLVLLASAALISAQSLMGIRYPGGISSSKTGLSSRMGGAGIGSDDPYLMMAHTPGNLGNISQSVYTLKLTLDYNRVKESGNYSDMIRMVPDLVGFAFPLGPAGTVGVGFSKERGNDYFYRSAEQVLKTNPVTLESLTGWTGFSRKSAVTVWEAGWGHSAFKMFRPGISYRRFYYSVEDCRVVKINNFGGTNDSVDIKHAGNSLRGGFSGTIGKVTYGLNGTYNFKGTADYNRTQISDTILSKGKTGENHLSQIEHDSAVTRAQYDIQMAPAGGIGISVKPNEKLLVSTDVSMEFGEKGWSSGPKSIFYTTYQNALSVSAGAQFIPAPELLAPRYFEKIRYSGGVRFSQLPVKGDWEGALSAGVGLPIGTSGLLDIAFEGGTRRSELLPNNSENFVRVHLTTSGGKPWKKKPSQVY